MVQPTPPHDAPSGPPDGDGVRITPRPRGASRVGQRALAAAAVLAFGAGAWWLLSPRHAAGDARAAGVTAPRGDPATRMARAPARTPLADAEAPRPTPDEAPDDLAAYFRPGDPEPTGAELIASLQAAGVRTGIGAFNPPGTSPPLAGLAVPDDFVLPPGYVRHHQVTDQGVALEPILMFSPDFTLHDAQGRRIPLPADRVVPPEYAPPGLPLRRVHAGTP